AGDVDDRERLLGPFGRDAEWIDLAAEDVALDQETDEAIEDGLASVDLVMLDGADRLGLPPNGGQLVGRRAAGVDIDGMDAIALLRQARHAVAGVEAAGEGERECLSLHSA